MSGRMTSKLHLTVLYGTSSPSSIPPRSPSTGDLQEPVRLEDDAIPTLEMKAPLLPVREACAPGSGLVSFLQRTGTH